MGSSPVSGSALPAQSPWQIIRLALSAPPLLSHVCALALSLSLKNKHVEVPGWLSHLSVQLLISGRVRISRFCELEPHIRLCADLAQNLLGILSLSLSLCPSPALTLSVSLKTDKQTNT